MKPLTDFLPELLPLLPGCPTPTVINAVRNSAIEFLEATGVFEQLQSIPMTPDVAAYEFDPDTGVSFRTLLRASIDGVDITPTTTARLDGNWPGWRAATGMPTHAFIEQGTVRVVPIPKTEKTIDCVFSASLSRTANSLDDSILDKWLEPIASGALRRLMAMPAVSWSNPDLAVYHRDLFDKAVGVAIVKMMQSGTTASTCVSPRRFGANY